EYKEQRERSFAYANQVESEVEKNLRQQRKKNRHGAITQDHFTGTYKDPWFGKVVITKEPDHKLRFSAVKSPDLTDIMEFYKGNTFVVKWDRRSIDADAFVLFSLDENGQADGFKMKAVSPLTDFSYDFQDLDFKRQK